MTISIRRATYEEAKSLKSFDVFVGDRRIDNWRGELFVFIEADAVVGYISYSSNLFYNRPYIALLCVKESHRRRGIGRQLVERVLTAYKGLDVWASTEEWNAAAIGLFESRGFQRMGTIRGLDEEESTEVFLVHRAEAVPARCGTKAF